MNKAKSIVFLTFISSIFLFASCSSAFTSKIEEPTNKSDTQSVVINSVYELSEDDPRAYAGAGKYVTLTFNPKADSSIVKDARTILPNDVSLYWTVTGSTAAYADTTTGGVVGEADTTKATAEANGAVVIESWYPTTADIMTGITLVLKVGKEYYFSAYGTNDSPATISTTLLGADYTLDTIYTDNSSKTDLFTKINGVTPKSPAKDVHYAIKQALTQEISSEAVAKGTSRYNITEENGEVKVYKYDEAAAKFSDTAASSIRIDASTNGINGTGNVLIPINLEATDSLDKGANYKVEKVEFRWVSTDMGGTSGSAVITDIDGAVLDTAMYIKDVPVGSYDTYLIFYSAYSADNTSYTDDIYTISDSLTVWKNQTSTLLASGSNYYTSSATSDTWTSSYVYTDTQSSTQAAPLTATANTTDTSYDALTGKATTKNIIAYKVSANSIKNSLRNVFYVTGDGANLTHNAAQETGSIHFPFDTVSDAISKIKENREKGYSIADTQWHIIIDGTPTAEDISYVNTVEQGLKLVIRPYTSSTVTLSGDIEFINDVANPTANPFKVWLTKVNWTPTAAAMFKVGTDVYLKTCKINGDVYDKAPTGDVLIYKDFTDATYTNAINGTIYKAGDDTSSVFGINVSTVTDGNIYSKVLVDYKWTDYTTGATESNQEFIANNPKIGDSSDAIDTSTDYYFALDNDFINNNTKTSTTNADYAPVLAADYEVGDTYGKLMLYAKITDVSIGFVNGVLKAALTSPATTTALTCSNVDANGSATWAAGDTKTIDVIFTVTSSDSEYPANGDDVLNVFKDGTTSLKISVYGENGGVVGSTQLSGYTLTYATAAEIGSSETEATYKITLTLDDKFAQSAYDKFISDGVGALDAYQAKFDISINGEDIKFQNSLEFTVAYQES